jgi:hypothetical protein
MQNNCQKSSVCYMTCTWPNIVFVVTSVFQRLNKIRPLHWSTIKGLFCYLKGIQNMAFSTPKT